MPVTRCPECNDTIRPCRCQLLTEIWNTGHRLTKLANMVIDLETHDFFWLGGSALCFARKEDFDLLFDYAHRDVLGIE